MREIVIHRRVEIKREYDCIVVGSGPSGICAAVSSARSGASTLLIERYGIIGGNLTVGHVGPIMGGTSPGTLSDEVRCLLETKGHDEGHDFEEAKIRLTQWVSENKVNVLLQTPVVDVIKEGDKVEGVIVSTLEGLEGISGKVIIDATGDGHVAYLAGCPYEKGREDGLMQPTSLMFTISGVDSEVQCRHEEDDFPVPEGSYLRLCEKKAREGELPSNVTIVRLYKTNKKGERIVNATQANKVDGTKVNELFTAEVELRQQMSQVLEFLKTYVPGFEKVKIRDSANTLGVRETRRFKGGYHLTVDDLMTGRRFPDRVVHKASFSIDIHNPDGGGQAESEGLPPMPQPYDIPYRSLVPQTIDGLLLTGRNISGSHHAHASYRVMNIAMALGEASGMAAALSVREGVQPRDLAVDKLQKALVASGVELFT